MKNDYDYGVIMEDNLNFFGDIPKHVNLYIDQLNTLYPDYWDIIFDSRCYNYKETNEGTTVNGLYVYPKSNELCVLNRFRGGTRLAQFYILNKKCAKKLYENYLPFNHSPDMWMNDLFRKLNIKSFWSEPSITIFYPHMSTV